MKKLELFHSLESIENDDMLSICGGASNHSDPGGDSIQKDEGDSLRYDNGPSYSYDDGPSNNSDTSGDSAHSDNGG